MGVPRHHPFIVFIERIGVPPCMETPTSSANMVPIQTATMPCQVAKAQRIVATDSASSEAGQEGRR